MASICVNRKNGHRTVQLVCADGKRRSIRLGKVSKRIAETVRLHVERLSAAKIADHAPDDETSRWLVGIDDRLHERLVAVGLLAPRHRATLAAFVDDYIAKRTDVKERTRLIFERTRDCLVEYFGADRGLRDITAGQAREWRLWLFEKGAVGGKPLMQNTVNDRCKKARQFFAAAVEHELVESNPFTKLPGTVRSNPDKFRFVTRRVIDEVIEACPSAEWRLLVALSRYGGLRCPSESLRLRWEDVNWETDRIVVPSPKTAHHEGGASRVIPIFAELRPYLEEAWELAEPGAEFVIPSYRKQDSNMGTLLRKIVHRAGVVPWPRPFHNLRATRQTELEDEFPSHVVCKWLGNSEKVAREHYLHTTDNHFAKAVQQPAASCGSEEKPEERSPAKPLEVEGLARPRDRMPSCSVHPAGFEPATFGSVDRCSIQLS